MHLGNQSASLDDETEYLFLGPNTQIHEDNDAVSTQTISRVLQHNELLVFGPVATKVWSRSLSGRRCCQWFSSTYSGDYQNTYYNDDETTERANDEDIRQYYYELDRANSQGRDEAEYHSWQKKTGRRRSKRLSHSGKRAALQPLY